MTPEKQEIAKILKRAIRGEEDGYRFYDMLYERATNDDAKRKLEGLRDDEIRHRETLKSIFAKHVGGEIGELPAKGLSVLSELFEKRQILNLKSEIELLNLAIEAEIAAMKFYQQERELIGDPEFEAIFDMLAEEENGHYDLLMAEREAMSGNYYWFSYDSSSPMED